ncbi:MAG: dTDP-4-dehydrorhamnose 3,5-epimerase [Desulfocapsa sp.]|uniref:dTDP-4-dehydrorhamnose 3,5-epimerase n=1 Tax=Desulfotalea psychrophila TaxID=84980 RepID=A0ABS3AZK3_9BACT|nr:dTDP-4-dehydrorhamnose 3,5-epimerase [Desulfocapsa sp.]MBN4068755.1 dTDP-4-dehydrorhamnose 3,5-epimerase [Desulfotalea psychrophila]
MIFEKTKLNDAYIIRPERLEDDRGFFARAWCQKEFEKHGLVSNLAQCNISYNKSQGTLRGMHYQKKPHEETKLVRCTAGAIVDVIIDIRPESSTFSQWLTIELSAENRTMLYVPRGFAHGYVTLVDDVEVFYQVSEFYTPGVEGGIRWDDPFFQIAWPIRENLVVSEKDSSWPDYEKDE